MGSASGHEVQMADPDCESDSETCPLELSGGGREACPHVSAPSSEGAMSR